MNSASIATEVPTSVAVTSFAAWTRHHFGYVLPPCYLAFLNETDGCQIENSILSDVRAAIRDNTSHELCWITSGDCKRRWRNHPDRCLRRRRVERRRVAGVDAGQTVHYRRERNVDKFLIQPDGTFCMANYFDIAEVVERFPAMSRFLERLNAPA